MKSTTCVLCAAILTIAPGHILAQTATTAGPSGKSPGMTNPSTGATSSKDQSRGRKRSSAPVKTGSNVPQFNYEPSCKAAVQAGATVQGRNEASCMRDEEAAKSTLEKEWRGFSASQKALCNNLEDAGGMPSYVEYLTCVEMGKATATLPKDNADTAIPQIEGSTARMGVKRPKETTGQAH